MHALEMARHLNVSVSIAAVTRAAKARAESALQNKINYILHVCTVRVSQHPFFPSI